jgi:hypothetical protein
VQEDTENIGADTSMQSLPAQQAPRNHKWNSPSKENAGLCEVQHACDPAADSDCQ